MQNQLSLFGNEDLICSWGSVNSNRGNHKVIECSTPQEVHNNLKRLVKVRKNREYNIDAIASSKTEINFKAIPNIEQLVLLLDKPEQFKIIRKYQKPKFYKADNTVPKQIGVFLDTETTGLSLIPTKSLNLVW
ncbi:MAG: hypothetical protein RCO49_08875 [Rickettsia endosymbiont of Argas persicus]